MTREETREAKADLNQRVYILRCKSPTAQALLRNEGIHLYKKGSVSTIAFKDNFYGSSKHFNVTTEVKNNQPLRLLTTISLEALFNDLLDKYLIKDINGQDIPPTEIGDVAYIGNERDKEITELLKKFSGNKRFPLLIPIIYNILR